MARETQGLQIAMIVFVLLTIVFGVSTFIFFSQYREADRRATATDQKGKENADAAREAIARMEELKEMMMGPPATDKVESIREKFNADMDKYAKTYPKEMQFYRPAIERLAKALEEKDESLTNEQATVAQLKAQLAAQTESMTGEMAKHDQAAKKAEQDKQGEIDKFGADRKKLEDDLAKMDGTVKQTRKDSDAAQTDLNAKLAAATGDAKKALDGYETAKKKLDAQNTESPDKFQGEVRWVNQHQGVVWIDLGRADALRPQTTFSVFAAGTGDMTEIGKKASIEVTEVLDNHLAKARVLDDQPANPIVPGDKIFTPVWSLGEKRHFAIAGLVDLNGDGRFDPEELRRLCTLIEMNGGVVDAPLDAEGKRRGKMTLDTRYLIEGEKPDAASSAALIADFSMMTGDAKNLRVETITLDKFLDRMGWRRESQVLDFAGGGGKMPVPAGRTPTVSGAKISEVFKPREPPRSNGGSTF
jgi:hypothetical protein